MPISSLMMLESPSYLRQRGNTWTPNASPLHMGLLGQKSLPEWHPALQQVCPVAQNSACEGFGAYAAYLGLQVCLKKPEFASTLIGISGVNQIVFTRKVLDWSSPAELLDVVRRLVTPVFSELGLPAER